jgi:predicted 3-demethylubiquinone-9 3-methyltransferase (glyoxalase superfamily)
MPKITPFLWFDTQAEEAAKFYVSVFKNSKITSTTRYCESSHGVKGSVMTVAFELNGQDFVALNGGTHFKINPAISFVVDCGSQDEIDYYWEKLTADGGKEVQCGWLEDKFGVSWQITPSILSDLVKDSEPERGARVMAALMQMVKLDIAKLKAAYEG